MLILTASMGAGHDGVAVELARRLAADGIPADVADVLELLPMRLGPALRRWYGWMMRSAPWLYALIYRVFFTTGPSRGQTGPASPLTVLAAKRLRRLVRRRRPAEVVSTFHLAAQAAGRLRERGKLPVPSTVLVTDFAVHRLWLHRGNDRYLCADPASALAVTAATGRPAHLHAPVVRPEFRTARADPERADRQRIVPRIGAGPGDRLVLVSAGSWGVGEVGETARAVARSGRYVPVVLCGHNDALRRGLERAGQGIALGWRDDMPELLASAYALVDNAAGLTCREAFAAGVPVVCYRPIPGHGRDGARAMAAAGLSDYATSAAGLLAALDRLDGTPERDRRIARGWALFSSASAESLLGCRSG
ncbi:MGDG synthase family glycosyltransferase [Planotetraspora sp. GP83]|uniref:MGDG synthase family glycosyltransferase n=1 Tax=Planotetraspora sp. GP83 TaxID=3156264 RepID=UPI0035159CBE